MSIATDGGSPALDPLALFTTLLCGMLLVERFVNAAVYTALYILVGIDFLFFNMLRQAEFHHRKSLAGMSTLRQFVSSFLSFLMSALSLLMGAVSTLVHYALTGALLLIMLGLFFLWTQYSGHFMLALSDAWNRMLGPSAQVLVVWPLQTFSILFDSVVPIWNAVIWLWKKVPHEVLLRTVTWDLGTIVAAGEELVGLCRSMAISLLAWIGSFICCNPDGSAPIPFFSLTVCNPRCLDPGNRVFDLLEPMAHVRRFVVYVAMWLKDLCSCLAGPIDLLTFPFMDINYAEYLHFFVNSVLFTVTHMPALTAHRCTMYGAESLVMCIPDLQPSFQMLVTALRSFGLFCDNWLDVLVLIVQASLGQPLPECTSLPAAVADVATQAALFGANATVIAGMTDTMFARTDGVAVQYFSLARDWQSVLHPDAFPFPVDVSYGVAAVAHIPDLHHDAKGDDTMALLGCACADTDAGLVLTCGAAVFDDQMAASERVIPVQFQLASTAHYMACSKLIVKVQSLRWPATRTTATTIISMDGALPPDPTCVNKGTCLQADAAVWIRPMCSADSIDLACVRSFTASGCFPYCMALHVRGSGTQPMIVHNADEWDRGVTMLARDCGLYRLSDPTLANATTSFRPADAAASTVLVPNSPYGFNARSTLGNCTYNPDTISIQPRSARYVSYSSLTLASQPFAFVGDLALVALRGYDDPRTGEPTWYIEVQRLFGDQANEFTLIPLAQYLPSAGPCTTPSDCGNVKATCSGPTGCLPAVPYSWDTHPKAYIPGTVTDRYAFYVTNPDLQPFEAFSYYCVSARTGRQATNKFQISAISSYGGIRLWRLDPYLYCPVVDGRHTCAATASAGSVQIQALDFTEFDVALCAQEFAVFAVGLDYVNKDNLALTVMRTTLDNIDTRTLEPLDPSRATYPVIWVNPNTLRWQEGRMWTPEASSPALIPGQLCPSQRRTPNVGSMMTESIVSVVLFVRLPLNIVLGMPVIMPLLNHNCPLITRGHWLLQTCGAELVSLDDFFHSVYRLNALFFQSFAIIADAFGPGMPQTFINGLAMSGENSAFVAMLPGIARQMAQLGSVDPLQSLRMVQNTMGGLPSRIQMAKQLSSNPVARAHYTYTICSRMLMKILQAAGGTATVGNVFWTTFADSMEYHRSIVVVRERRLCDGLALMAGYTSPVAMLFDRWCNAFVSLEEGILTMLSVFTVEIPLMACICKQSQGYNFQAHVVASCFPDCPDLYKPLVVQLLAQYGDDPGGICPYLVEMSGAHFTTALDPMFAEIEAGNRMLASVLDSFIIALDSEAGDCNNFQDNPYVITLVPEPVDYFRVCGTTTDCRDKCLSEFQAFEALAVGEPAAETVLETVQSPLFTALDGDAYNPLSTAFAMLELASCDAMCGNSSDAVGDRCFLLSGMDSATQRPTVMGFCVPIDVSAGVRKAGAATLENFPPSTRAAPILQAAFVWRPDLADDFWAQYRFVVMTSTTMYQCGHYGPCAPLYAIADLGADVSSLVSFVAVGNTLVQRALYYDGVLPSSTSTRIYSYTLIEFYAWLGPFDVTSVQNLWPDWDYSYVVCEADPRNLCTTVLLVPFTRVPGEDLPPPVQMCHRGVGDAFVFDCVSHDVARSFIYQASIPPPSNPSDRSATVFAQTGRTAAATDTWSVFMTVDQASFWLKVVGITGSAGASEPSLPTTMRLTVNRPCSIQNCVGCATLAVQQVCYAAQQCQVARCIGTMVHMRRPLCAIGMTIQSLVGQEMALVRGAWLVVSQTMVEVLVLSTGGVQLPSAITWPDQAFYGYVCNAKDTSATALSILVSSINGVVLSIAETPVVEASLQSHNIDNRVFALFTMSSAATTNFLNQIALGPLYAMLAIQKTMICTANSVLATVGVNSITIGDPSMQTATDKALGRCMSQYATENTQGGATGVKSTKALSAEAVGALALSVGLDYIMHPLDATFTWLQGCVSGLQDVVETLARSRYGMGGGTGSVCVGREMGVGRMGLVVSGVGRGDRRGRRRMIHRVGLLLRRHDAPIPCLALGLGVVPLVDVLGDPAQAPRAHGPGGHAVVGVERGAQQAAARAEALRAEAAGVGHVAWEVAVHVERQLAARHEHRVAVPPCEPAVMRMMIYPSPGSCKLPDSSVVRTFQCACNDTAYQMAPARASEGLAGSAFWCTTVMSMLAYDGSQTYIYNPFTLAQLRSKLDKPPAGLPLDAYLACVAGGGGQCAGPTDPFFVRQQVSMVAVYQRCLANYQSLQWDLGTHVLFNATLRARMPVAVPEPDCVPVPGYGCVGDCVLLARAAGSSPAACLDAFLQGLDVAAIDHFQYIPLPPEGARSSQIDACGAFTGPARLAFPGQGDFQSCLSQYDNTSLCQLPLMVWSGRSSNRVPVASPHATRMLTEAERVDAARRVFRETRDSMRALLTRLNSTWTANDLEIAIFSAEGDLLHQYFDCVMMGALATKVDLWPSPDAVNKPFWSRRTDGATSREFELPCSGAQLHTRLGAPDTKTPLTCGSHSRRSAIKYFLRRALSGGGQDAARQTILKVVRELIAQLMAAWVTDDTFLNYQCQCDNGTHAYGCCVFDCTFHSRCLCPDGVSRSYACCGCVSTSLLPSVLQVPFTTIPGNKTMGGVIDQAAAYLKSTIWTSTDPWLAYDPGAVPHYDWNAFPAQASLAQDHALFDTTGDVAHYSTAELGKPMGTTIWEMCMGLAGQVHHTLPLDPSSGAPTTLGAAFNPPSSAASGGWSASTINLTYTEDWIKSLMLDAYARSPLFWHYSMRHTPSPSTMCQRTAPAPLTPVSSSSSSSPIATYGWSALTLGGVGLDCYCGWWLNATHCQPPAAVCDLLFEVAYGGPDQHRRCLLHRAGEFDMEDAMRALEAYLDGQWPSAWPCPALMASDHWGFLGQPAGAVLNRTLFRGPSGLRAGSLNSQGGKLLMNPFQRTDAAAPPPLQCNPSPPRSLVDHFVDDLFPAAQGVRQSPVVSYCLRFIIELARRLAYQDLGLGVAAAQQIQVEATWRKRCEAKLNQTIFCEVYGVFAVPLSSSASSASCPFTLAQNFRSLASITPSCLVLFSGRAYDPCLCNPVFCAASPYVVTPTSDLFSKGDLCRVPHPRDYVVHQINDRLPLSSWPPPAPLSSSADPSAGSSTGGASSSSSSSSPIPSSLATSNFPSHILNGNLLNIANNNAFWATAEGNATTQFCDLIVDWWPEHWMHPVGYHVTVPCTGAAHRTFDAAWAAMQVGDRIQMHYAPDALRDRNRSTSAFGASGLCRAHSVAMPMDILNPIRLCTQADNQGADPFVPARAAFGPAQWGAEHCATSPFSVPWDPSAASAPTSIGTVPRPSALSPLALLAFNGWDVDGPQPLSQCASGADCCPTCQCLLTPSGGVCAVLQSGVMECLAHAHCGAQQRMCAGDALCTQGLLEVTNPGDAGVSVRTFSSNCSLPGSLDTWGLSKEEVVPDLLRSSGMCSWRSWYEHRSMQAAGGAQCSASMCLLPATETWNYTAPSLQPSPAFASGLLKVQAHACDKDYEHLPGLSSCSPSPSSSSSSFRLLDEFGAPIATLEQTQRTRTYRYVAGASVPQLPLVRHAGTDNMGAGFLGANLTYTQLGYDTYTASGSGPKPVLCSSLALCSTQSAWRLWHVNGVAEANRTVGPSASQLRLYSTTDMIQCGSMGYLLNPTTCAIDPAVVPLFYYYCNNNYNTYPLCSSYRNGQYSAGQGPDALTTIASQLNGLLVSQAHTVNTWSSYLTYVDAADSIYASIQAMRATTGIAYTTGLPTGLYYLLSYSAYEVPFAWWWRCTWMQGIPPGPDPVPCGAWDPSAAATPLANGATMFNVSGGAAGVPGLGVTTHPLIAWLAGLDAGVFTSASVSAARAYVQQRVNDILASPSWVPRDGFNFSCYERAGLRADLLNSSTTNRYYARAAYSYAGRAWAGAVSGSGPGAAVCSGAATCLDYGPSVPTKYDLVAEVAAAMQPSACASGCAQCVPTTTGSVCAYAQDDVPSQLLSNAPEWLDLFQIQLPDISSAAQAALQSKYDPKTYGSSTSECNLFPTCPSAPDCACVFTDLQPEELSMIGLASPRPDLPPAVAFGSAFSLDVCSASGAGQGSRCNLQSQPLSDTCAATTLVQRTTMSLYCSSGSTSPASSYYSDAPMFSNGNPASDQCLLSECFQGASIQNTVVSIPPGVGLDVVYTPPIPCYNLSCDAGSSNDGHVVLDPAPYTSSSYTQYRMYFYQTQYTYPGDRIAWRYHRIQLLQGDTASLMITKTRYCLAASQTQAASMLAGTMPLPANVPDLATLRSVLCASNKLNTRSLSADFAEADFVAPSYTPSNPSIPASFYAALLVDLVSSVENVIELVPSTSNAGIVCAVSLPTDLRMCNFTNGTVSNALAVAQACSDAEALAQCQDVGAHLCSGRSTAHTYDKTKCDLERAAAAAAAVIIPFPWGFAAAAAAEAIISAKSPECYQGPTDFERCTADFQDLGTCRSRYNLQCNVYVYQRDENHSPCKSTRLSCPYNVVQPNQARSWEQQYMDAGLPATGFCPECYGTSSYTGCGLAKSTKTFQVAQAATGLHAFTTTGSVANATQLGANAQYARVRFVPFSSAGLQHPVQCGPPACPPLQRAVEFRRNLYTCAPCFAAPLTECTGQHDCAFGGFAGFAAAYAAARSTIQAYLNGASAGLRPTWMPWLRTWNFSEYNPHALTYGFNAAITKLNGQCKVSGALPEPSQCQNDGPRRTLRAHVQSQYKVAEGAGVPPGATLTWAVSPSQLVGVNLPAWEAHPRPSASFMQALLSDDVCAQFTFDSMVCLQQPTLNATLLFNPQIAGDFEIAQGCDTALQDGTTRIVSSACNQLACPATSSTYDTYNAYAAGSSQSVWTACKLQDHTTPRTFTTGSSVPTNICGRTPATPLTCTAAQGAFLGGVPQGWGASVKDLYAYHTDKASPIRPTTLVQMVAGAATAATNLGVGAWDLGGHYIRTRVSGSGFALGGLPLRSYASLAAAQAMNATDWVGAWLRQARPVIAQATCATWACPFRRRFHWTGSKPPTSSSSSSSSLSGGFSPITPDPARTLAIFGTPSHPSAAPTSASVLNQLLASYVSANGFCVCPTANASACLATFYADGGSGPAGAPCSRADLIAALVDFQPRVASVLGNVTCPYQLDWPWVVGGPLRDGAYLPTNRVRGPCAVLDRLPAFRYRFMDSGTKLPAAGGATTLDEGGDCHLARPARVTSPPSVSLEPGACVVTAKTAASVTLTCADGTRQTLPRPTSASVLPTTTATTSTSGAPGKNSRSTASRTPCTKCTPPPAFFVDNQSLPVPETSYGTPWRWSPSRLLARDLRFSLCGNATQCPQVADWHLDDFWGGLLQGTLFGPIPSKHSINALVAQATSPAAQQALNDDDAAQWSKPWLLCTTNGSGAAPWCSGSISKAAWLNGGDRTAQCKAVLEQPNAAEAAVDLSICDLDAGMNLLCTAVQQARYAVFEANCQLTGRCRTTAFFYQPATYAIDDNQFVRSVVGNFYNFSSAGACPVLDAETQAILASNAQAAQNCPAQDLEAIQMGLQAARAALHSFVSIVYYLGIIGIDLVALVTGSNVASTVASIVAAFNAIAAQFVSFFATLGDVFFKLIMETGNLGRALRALVTQLCTFARDVFQLVIMPFLCAAQSAVVWLLNAIASIVAGVSGLTFGALDGAVGGIHGVVSSINSNSMCSSPPTWDCGSLFPTDASLPTSLPMPTRCWVGYMPDPGDLGGGLGCTASDTCMDDDGSLRACASCETSISGAAYGCDSLTKLCRCHVSAVSQTRCASHQECALLPDTVCGFVDAYLQPSFGNVQCASCTAQPICLVTGRASTGACVCTLRPTSLQTCSQASVRVVPNPAQLCLVSLSPSAIAQSAQYSATYLTLASAQCALLNQAQSYCLTVYQGSTGALMVVGLSLLSTSSSRRMLSWEHEMWPIFGGAGQPWRPNLTEWALADDPCRSVMQEADNRTLGPYDRHLASECQRWRDIGERIVVALNLTRIPPVRFTSWTALLSTVAHDDQALRQMIERGPQVAAYLLSYHPLSQVATLAALRLWRVLPNRTAILSLFQRFNGSTLLQTASPQTRSLLKAEDILMRELVVPSLLLLMSEHGEEHDNGTTAFASRAAEEGNATGQQQQRPLLLHHRRTNHSSTRAGHPHHHRRELLLLVDSWKDTLAQVQQFSTQVVSGQAASLAPDIANQWSSGPFAWPPDYSADGPLASSSCLFATIVFNLTYLTMVSTVNYYTGAGPVRPAVQRTFFECVPRLPPLSNRLAANASSANASSSNRTAAATITTTISNDAARLLDAVFAAVIDRDRVIGYISRNGDEPSQLSQDIETFVLCDFDSVQHCTKFGRDLGWGALIVLLGLGAISFVAKRLGIPGLDPLLVMGYVPLVSVFVFGVSPLCWPMVCTCFVDEVVHLSRFLLPVAIEWPAMLQYWPGCLNGTQAPEPSLAWRASSAACFRPCTDWPFEFNDARDNVAWLTLRSGAPRLPASAADTLAYLFSLSAPVAVTDWLDANLLGPMQARYAAKAAYIGWPDMVSAQDTCCFLTGFNLVILGAALFCAAMALSFVLLLPVLLLHFLYQLLISLLVYIHTH